MLIAPNLRHVGYDVMEVGRWGLARAVAETGWQSLLRVVPLPESTCGGQLGLSELLAPALQASLLSTGGLILLHVPCQVPLPPAEVEPGGVGLCIPRGEVGGGLLPVPFPPRPCTLLCLTL